MNDGWGCMNYLLGQYWGCVDHWLGNCYWGSVDNSLRYWSYRNALEMSKVILKYPFHIFLFTGEKRSFEKKERKGKKPVNMINQTMIPLAEFKNRYKNISDMSIAGSTTNSLNENFRMKIFRKNESDLYINFEREQVKLEQKLQTILNAFSDLNDKYESSEEDKCRYFIKYTDIRRKFNENCTNKSPLKSNNDNQQIKNTSVYDKYSEDPQERKTIIYSDQLGLGL
ncbi:unnamed protein product, partial [Leptidea sinapis]